MFAITLQAVQAAMVEPKHQRSALLPLAVSATGRQRQLLNQEHVSCVLYVLYQSIFSCSFYANAFFLQAASC